MKVLITRLRNRTTKAGEPSVTASCQADGKLVWYSFTPEAIGAHVDMNLVPADGEAYVLPEPIVCDCSGVVVPELVVAVGADDLPIYNEDGSCRMVQATFIPEGNETRSDGRANHVAVWTLTAPLDLPAKS